MVQRRQATKLDRYRAYSDVYVPAQSPFYRIVYSCLFSNYLSNSAFFLCWSCSCRSSYSYFFYIFNIRIARVGGQSVRMYVRPIINEREHRKNPSLQAH